MGQEHPPLHPLQRVPAPAVPPRCGPRRTVSRPFSFFLRSLAKKAAHTPHPAARLNTQATLTTRTSSGAAASSPARTSRAASRRTTMPLAGEKRRSEDRMHGAASAALRCAERKKGRGWGGGTRRACAVVGTRLALVRATLALTPPPPPFSCCPFFPRLLPPQSFAPAAPKSKRASAASYTSAGEGLPRKNSKSDMRKAVLKASENVQPIVVRPARTSYV